MGIAIQYCIFCQEQIPPKDVTDGRAIQSPGGYVCTGCAKKAGLQAGDGPPSKHLTPAPRRLSAASNPAVRMTAHPTPSPPSKDPHASHVSHVSHASHASHTHPPPAKRSTTPLILGGIGLVIGILLLVIMVNRGADTPKPAPTPTLGGEAPDPRIAQIKFALANAKEIDPKDYDLAISALRDAAKILPGSEWAREAEAGAATIGAARDKEAQKEFDRRKEEAEGWESTGGFAGAVEEWDHFPRRLLGGDWAGKVAAEKKAIEGRRLAFEREAQELANDVLRKAAGHADRKEYDVAIQALDTYPARFKSTKWAAEVAQAKSRYQDAIGTTVKQAAGDVDTAEKKCIQALLSGDVSGARKAWEPLLTGSHASIARSEIQDLADIETDRDRDGVAIWIRGNHIVVVPKSIQAWQGETKGVIRIAGTADLEEDGTREVFVGIDGLKEDAGAMVCMGLDGTKRWQFNTGAIHWSQDGCTDKMNVSGLKIADLDGDGKREVITVSNHIQLFPCRVCVLSWEGKLISEYWNPGHGGSPFVGDIDGDEKPEVLISFVNNDMEMTQVLACFKGTNIRGTAPPGGKDGTQVWYTKLPGAKAPMKRVTWKRDRKDGPATRIECEFQDGTWVLAPDGTVLQKP